MRSWVLVLLLPALVGCVERKLVVKSDPPGAVIYVDGTRRGVAGPEGLEVAFESYGTRTVTARLEGHTPVRQDVELKVPWYQVFPLGLFSDLLYPGTIVDAHPVRVALSPRGAPLPAKDLAEEAAHFADTQERRP